MRSVKEIQQEISKVKMTMRRCEVKLEKGRVRLAELLEELAQAKREERRRK